MQDYLKVIDSNCIKFQFDQCCYRKLKKTSAVTAAHCLFSKKNSPNYTSGPKLRELFNVKKNMFSVFVLICLSHKSLSPNAWLGGIWIFRIPNV